MLANKVYELMEELKKGKVSELDKASINFLKDKGFISVMPFEEYDEKSSAVKKLDSLRKERDYYKYNVEGYQNGVDDISKKLSSRWYRLWTSPLGIIFKNKKTVENYKDSLKKTKKSLDEFINKFDPCDKEVRILESLKNELEGYVKTPYEYAKTTEIGNKKTEQISIRLMRLDNVSYDMFEKEFDETQKAILERYDRFKQFYNFLIEKKFEKGDSDVIQYALSLSGQKGTVDEIYENAKEIDILMNKTFKKYEYDRDDEDRLKIIPVLLSIQGEMENTINAFKELYEIALKNDNDDSYQTLYETALNLKSPLSTPIEKYDRYNEMQNELKKKGWEKGSAATCYIAANLSKKQGDAESIAEEFRSLEKKLIKKGIDNSIESGIAALILFDEKETHDEKADKFIQSFKMMKKYGWDNDSDYYAAAALISLMPKTIEENVQWLDEVIKIMEKDGFEDNLTYRAIPIMGGGYRDILNLEDASSFESSSYSSSDDYSSYTSSPSSDSSYNDNSSSSGGFGGFGGGSSGGGGASGGW